MREARNVSLNEKWLRPFELTQSIVVNTDILFCLSYNFSQINIHVLIFKFAQ